MDNINVINIANLAYLGDAVYELAIREYLLINDKNKVHILKEHSTDYVSANSQSDILDYLIENNFLTDMELELIKRARNYRPNSKPKHTLIKDYKKATALEALFGSLYMNNDKRRIEELINIIVRR